MGLPHVLVIVGLIGFVDFDDRALTLLRRCYLYPYLHVQILLHHAVHATAVPQLDCRHHFMYTLLLTIEVWICIREQVYS